MSQTRNEVKKHLLLFVDINGTITVSDSAKGQHADAALNKLLAENITGVWETNVPNMSYRKYIDTYKYKNAKKEERENYYVNFINHLETIEHPEAKNVKTTFLELKENLNNKNIFSSFIRLIDKLNKDQVKYSVILRTFGNDLNSTMDELKKETGIEFKPVASFEKHAIKEHKISDLNEMLEFFKQGHRGIQDEHAYWAKEHKETYEGGKLFPIKLDNTHIESIFFDDNALWKQILSVKIDDKKILNQELLQQELARQKRIISVNTLKAIQDPNYFIDIVDYVLKNEMNKSEIVKSAFQQKLPIDKGTDANKNIRFFNSSLLTPCNEMKEDSKSKNQLRI